MSYSGRTALTMYAECYRKYETSQEPVGDWLYYRGVHSIWLYQDKCIIQDELFQTRD